MMNNTAIICTVRFFVYNYLYKSLGRGSVLEKYKYFTTSCNDTISLRGGLGKFFSTGGTIEFFNYKH